MIKYSYCHGQYIDKTGQPVNVRLNRLCVDMAKKLPKAVAQHFNPAGHNFDDLKLYICKSNFWSEERENIQSTYTGLSHKFSTLQPEGINVSKGALEFI